MGEDKYKKCFQDLSECQLFLEFPFNKFFFFHLYFFFKTVFLPSISLLKIWWEPFLFSSFWHFPFFFSFFNSFFFSFFFEFSHKPSRWNKLIKFHLKTLWIRALRRKGSTGWLAIMYQKRKTHIWLKVDKNGLISSLKD